MKLELLASLNAERAARRAAVLLTDMESGEAELIRSADLVKAPLAGTEKGEPSPPRSVRAAARWPRSPDGRSF